MAGHALGSPWVPMPRVELWASNGLGVPFLGECTSGLIVTAMVSKLKSFSPWFRHGVNPCKPKIQATIYIHLYHLGTVF